jgi:L-alanine-DL-glutamate epimerase-like enolase superfamily enzyme
VPPALCTEPLRKELVSRELDIKCGAIVRPTSSGFGIEVDRAALKRFSVE